MSIQDDSRLYIAQRFDHAAQLLQEGKAQQAVDIADEAVRLALQSWGERSSEYAKALNDLGVIVSGAATSHDDLEQARQLFVQAYELEASLVDTITWRACSYCFHSAQLSLHVGDLKGADYYLTHMLRMFHGLNQGKADAHVAPQPRVSLRPGL